jgi:hypothetical protein
MHKQGLDLAGGHFLDQHSQFFGSCRAVVSIIDRGGGGQENAAGLAEVARQGIQRQDGFGGIQAVALGQRRAAGDGQGVA